MSAKKSWDIAPRARKPVPTPAKTPSPRVAPRAMDMQGRSRVSVPVQPSVPVSKRNVAIPRAKKQRAESREPLKKRRKKTQKAFFIVVGALVLVLIAISFYLVWLPAFRISSVTASGPHADEARLLAQRTLEGTHAFILPRNSLFFIPESDVRTRILAAHPDIEAVSISAAGLNELSIKTLPRAEAFVWCGASAELADGQCYSANAEGLIFAPVPLEVSSTSEALRIFAAIEGQQGETPVTARISYASRIPEALRFIKAIQTLGANVVSVSFRADEADLYTEAGTRITYVLGREQEAVGIAASVFPQLSLNDGSVSYVDLRFSGKAYFKRANEASVEE